MSAINIHIETQDPEDRIDDSCAIPGVALGGPRTCPPPITQMHVGQTRMVWVRRALTEWMRHVQYRVVVYKGVLAFETSEPFRNEMFPWLLDKSVSQNTFALIGKAAKMAGPTWDLPAGAGILGGSCPGASSAQSPIPLGKREKAAEKVVGGVRLEDTICQLCYAEGGNYATFTTQLGELIRHWWTETLLKAKREDEWVSTMVEAIRRCQFPIERLIDPRTSKPVLPFRIHSAGDFYSRTYARAWIKVINQLPEVMFWAPTRTWAAGSNWIKFWSEAVPTIIHNNLSLRPSAFHTNAFAPSREHPEGNYWEGSSYPFTSAGTTAVYKKDDKNHGEGMRSVQEIIEHGSRDPRYDWQCGTYAIFDAEKDCQKAVGSDGKVGCRACWLSPLLRVNYTVH